MVLLLVRVEKLFLLSLVFSLSMLQPGKRLAKSRLVAKFLASVNNAEQTLIAVTGNLAAQILLTPALGQARALIMMHVHDVRSK